MDPTSPASSALSETAGCFDQAHHARTRSAAAVICPAMRSRPFFISCGPVGNLPRDRFTHGCLLSQGVGSPRFYFPGCENPRHSRGLGWRASVSDWRFLEFRSLRGGFRAPVSGRHFPISISVGQRPPAAVNDASICCWCYVTIRPSAPALFRNRAGPWRGQ